MAAWPLLRFCSLLVDIALACLSLVLCAMCSGPSDLFRLARNFLFYAFSVSLLISVSDHHSIRPFRSMVLNCQRASDFTTVMAEDFVPIHCCFEICDALCGAIPQGETGSPLETTYLWLFYVVCLRLSSIISGSPPRQRPEDGQKEMQVKLSALWRESCVYLMLLTPVIGDSRMHNPTS